MNQIYINWGVFNSSTDSSDTQVQGPMEPYEYMIFSTYGDYFDRKYITDLYMTLFVSSILGPLSPFIQFFPAALLLLYVFAQPLLIQLLVVPSEAMTVENYLWDVIVRQ